MSSKLHKRSRKTGLAPGSLVHVGSQYTEKSKITLIRYHETFFEEKELRSIKDFHLASEKEEISWLNIDGLQDIKLFEDIGEMFGLHPLVLEDILNTDQRPKAEDYGDYIYLVLKNFHGQANGDLLSDQISVILGKNFILSFQEKESDLFKSIKRENKSETKAGSAGKKPTIWLMPCLIASWTIILLSLKHGREN